MNNFEQDYLEAALPDFTVILGKRLLPFSLAHWITLTRLKSPFLDDRHATYRELLEAVWICSHTYEDIIRRWGAPLANLQIFLTHLRFSWLGFRPVPCKKRIEFMRVHITRGFNRPFLDINPVEGESSGYTEINSPVAQTLLVHLMEKCNQSLSQVMNQPLPFSYWLSSTLIEKSGGAKITTIEEIIRNQNEAEEAMAKIEAQLAEAAKKGIKVRGQRGGPHGVS